MESESIRDTTIGEIRAELARQHITQQQLADRLGWSRMYITRRLAGHVPLSLDDVEEIANALDVPALSLATRKSA